MLTLVVARDRNGAIGKDGDIPWHAPEDLRLFQRETTGAPIIMGSTTWNSLPYRPLKNRLNIVVSSGAPEGAEHVVTSVEDAISMAYGAGHARIYGIGGAGIYRSMLPLADRLLITEVDLDVEAPDTWFPDVDPAIWRVARQWPLREDAPRCTLLEFLRTG